MNHWLQRINFFGVMIIAALCVAQWQANRRLNLEAIQQEKTRLSHIAELEEQSKKIKGYAEDLESFRGDLTRANSSAKEQREKTSSAEILSRQLTEERDQLKTSITNWVNAVAERDARLKEDNERILKLGEDLNASVRKFNELASNYNVVVTDLNALRAPPVKEESK